MIFRAFGALARPLAPRVKRRSDVLAISFADFWPGFNPNEQFWKILLTESFGEHELVTGEAEADLVFASVFPHQRARFPEKTIAVIWENLRPNYNFYRFSLSSDFDSYAGRNCRLPVWYREIDWSESFERQPDGCVERVPLDGHGFEERVQADRLLAPHTTSSGGRPKFCCLITRYREPYRALAVEALSEIAPVDVVGLINGSPLTQSKYEFLRDYRFNLCFENSLFPGYYTEKALQAWAAGCIPLYFSDASYSIDFNPRAMINRISFASLDAFVDKVRGVNDSPELFAQFQREPLLLSRPKLDEVIAFLRRAAAAITEGKTTSGL